MPILKKTPSEMLGFFCFYVTPTEIHLLSLPAQPRHMVLGLTPIAIGAGESRRSMLKRMDVWMQTASLCRSKASARLHMSDAIPIAIGIK
jgi:hypothetical protein